MNTGSEKILVVDDDPIIVETIVQALEEDEFDYEVISASDGFEAGLQVNHFAPHLLILDIMMPGVNGYEVCEKLKSGPGTGKIKIVAISGDPGATVRERILDSGADLFFTKPLEIAKFRKKCFDLLKS